MTLMQLLFGLEGRIGRMLYLVVGFSANLFVTFLGVAISVLPELLLIWLAALPLLMWSGIATMVKRVHDRDRSGWFVLIAFVPVIGAIWLFVECLFLPGTPGPNRYGDEAYAPEWLRKALDDARPAPAMAGPHEPRSGFGRSAQRPARLRQPAPVAEPEAAGGGWLKRGAERSPEFEARLARIKGVPAEAE